MSVVVDLCNGARVRVTRTSDGRARLVHLPEPVARVQAPRLRLVVHAPDASKTVTVVQRKLPGGRVVPVPGIPGRDGHDGSPGEPGDDPEDLPDLVLIWENRIS